MAEKLFTKSAFKTAMACPWRLYYARNPKDYANTDTDNEFLAALAKGGFQVGALAKYYCQVPKENDLEPFKDYDTSLQKTQELFQNDTINIAEAAFQYANLFVRVDILQRKGNTIRLIEVKAKSWNPQEDTFIHKDSQKKDAPVNTIWGGIREYVYDVAFQKYVVVNALQKLYPTELFTVEAYLMMADKSKVADIPGMNQLFKIVEDEQGHSYVMPAQDIAEQLAQSQQQILTAFSVDDACNRIIAGTTQEQQNIPEKNIRGILDGKPFVEFVKHAAECYCSNKVYPSKPILGGKCFKCPFTADENAEMKSGVEECWQQYMTKQDIYHRPLVKELNGSALGAKRGQWMTEGTYFLDQITENILKTSNDRSVRGLDNYSRKWLQIGLATQNEKILSNFRDGLKGNTSYLDTEGLKKEMSTWEYPLHMIDFETTAVALPYYKGMKPYEQVAFQFSHHIIDRQQDGSYTIQHAGQYLNNDVKAFPNFESLRELKRQLECDNGTIFRYANHENSILRAIVKQLEDSDEADKQELITFVDTITTKKERYQNDRGTWKEAKIIGKRNMVDLLEVVKRYYYNYPEMHGSNSIKQVLPAVLNTSTYLQNKYSKPLYGSTQMPSKNLQEGKSWITYIENNRVDNPYHLLPKLEDIMFLTEDEKKYIQEHEFEGTEDDDFSNDPDADFSVANGGAALVAYSKMMFCDGQEEKYEAIRKALLQYCELDTLAMVFIWEYFYHEINQ